MPELTWQKSSYCPEGNSCVHVAADPARTIHLTESSDPTAAILSTTPDTFAALVRTAKKKAYPFTKSSPSPSTSRGHATSSAT
ncbi:DUF397 domain-containing protein [Streptomyces venezuelae]|uniref:DUF397 domain-containing protein n=1 Tax=Streptomyces venezuelae TaxID=54571 RepID=UPI003456718F